MKQRFSSLDIKIIAHELSKSLVTLRLSNVYDLSSRIFLLKFAKPEHREQLIVESGFRCHLTDFSRATAATPSAFVARLRKFLRTRRVTAVSQIGTDRLIEISFSEGQYRLLVEFYAGGNVILTDNDLKIIALLRTVSDGPEHEHCHVGASYDLSQRQNYIGIPELNLDRVRTGLQAAVDRQQDANDDHKKSKKKPGEALRRALAASINEYPPILLDHALTSTGFDKTLSPSDILADQNLMDKLMATFDEARRIMSEITTTSPVKGFILAKRRANTTRKAEDDYESKDDTSNRSDLLYHDFHPFRPCQFEAQDELEFLEFSGFNKTVDEFFSSIEGQKLESRVQERQDNAQKRIDNAKREHDKRIGTLQQVQDSNVQKAQAIEANHDRVEEATAAINGLIAQGMDWHEVNRLIEMEQKRHNPVAEIIRLPLKLQENTATLALASWDAAGDDDDDIAQETDSEPSDDEVGSLPASNPTGHLLCVDVDLGLSAWANARQYYEKRRAAATKQDKTVQASVKALKNTEHKIKADLKKGLKQEKQILTAVRRQMWFEKFFYFVSSDGYLVLGSRDAQQSDLLYKRHLNIGDVFVHADLAGAATVIVKNNAVDAPIPPSTLSQAGSLTVCTSNAWESKAVMSAWWVDVKAVSKTAPTGDYLPAGSFHIDGKKNYLPPAQLLLGFAVMFHISEESKANHVKHRVRDLSTDEKLAQSNTECQVDDDEGENEFPDVLATSTEIKKDQQKSANKDETDDEFPDAGEASSSDDHHDLARSVPRVMNPLQPMGYGVSSDDEATEPTGYGKSEDGTTAKMAEDVSIKTRSQPDPAHETSESESQTKTKTKTTPQQPPSAQQPVKVKTTPLPRGKRTKAKKVAAKYAEQDDEERKVALALLGSRHSGTADLKTENDGRTPAPATETASEARDRRRAQHETTQKKGLEEEALRRQRLETDTRLTDADADADDESEKSSGPLDAFVGTPLPGDEILDAIPVCAPWSALSAYKYKAKLQPGATKKGKAVREVLGKWIADHASARLVDREAQDRERLWPREGELLRAWKEVEIVGVVPVKSVRLVLAGATGSAPRGKSVGKGKRGGRGSLRK